MAKLTAKIWLNNGDKAAFFMAKVINNPNMDRGVLNVPTEFIITKGKFAAYLYDRKGNLVFKMVDSINVEDYIDFIMNY